MSIKDKFEEIGRELEWKMVSFQAVGRRAEHENYIESYKSLMNTADNGDKIIYSCAKMKNISSDPLIVHRDHIPGIFLIESINQAIKPCLDFYFQEKQIFTMHNINANFCCFAEKDGEILLYLKTLIQKQNKVFSKIYAKSEHYQEGKLIKHAEGHGVLADQKNYKIIRNFK